MTTQHTDPIRTTDATPALPQGSTAYGIPLETEIEHTIASQPRWLLGLDWGRPRPGHPEGSIRSHILAVLRNVDSFFLDSPLRPPLRLIALIHDSFKHEVDPERARSGENHHGMIARRFAEPWIDEAAALDVIELHDEAYNAWQKGARDNRWDRAEQRAAALLQRLGPNRELYVAFYRCDNSVEGKSPECYEWFCGESLWRRLPHDRFVCMPGRINAKRVRESAGRSQASYEPVQCTADSTGDFAIKASTS